MERSDDVWDNYDDEEVKFMFVCECCGKLLGPGPNVSKEVYDDRPVCLICRESAGERISRPLARVVLAFEKQASGWVHS